jgi:type III secretion system FlhB-like substrate exporter
MKKPYLAIGISKGSKEPSITINQEILPVEQIIQLAKEYNIPVVFDPNLAQQLANFDVDEELPKEFVLAIEETLSYFRKKSGDI